MSDDGIPACGHKIVRSYVVNRRKSASKIVPPVPHKPPIGYAWKYVAGARDGYWEMYNIEQLQLEAYEISVMRNIYDSCREEHRIYLEVDELLRTQNKKSLKTRIDNGK